MTKVTGRPYISYSMNQERCYRTSLQNLVRITKGNDGK